MVLIVEAASCTVVEGVAREPSVRAVAFHKVAEIVEIRTKWMIVALLLMRESVGRVVFVQMLMSLSVLVLSVTHMKAS